MPDRGRLEDMGEGTSMGHGGDAEKTSPKMMFIHALRKALRHLYDPGALRHSPLTQLFGLGEETDPVLALRDTLADAVESLKPGSDVPPESTAWRVYHILCYRYVEQSLQHEVADDLALSIRQLRRQEKIALEILADQLWARYDLADRSEALIALSEREESSPVGARTPSRAQELAWLEMSVPSEEVDLRVMLEAVLRVVRPLVQEMDVSLEFDVPDLLPRLAVQPTATRQALVHVLTIAARCVPGGHARLAVRTLPRQAYIHAQIRADKIEPGPADAGVAEELKMAQRLIRISGGSLEVEAMPDGAAPFTVDIILPTATKLPVFVIDDNVDTLRLIERFLADSRYRFLGTSDPKEAVPLAVQESPSIILLDVMLPGIDGWELLGHLREHPELQDVPIIVCTIVPQERLALTLGASGFLSKPVSREELLFALDRLVTDWSRKPP